MSGTIDKLFGSKTRVKLLQLFLNNPGNSYYVREITRTIDEQINSVRRELANMLSVGIIVSESSDNKLYYQINQRYEHYVALRAIFADSKVAALEAVNDQREEPEWYNALRELRGVKVVLLAGVLVEDSTTSVDLLIVGASNKSQVKKVVGEIESFEGRELNYTSMTFDDFYYRLQVRDRFLLEIMAGEYLTLVDTQHIVAKE